MSLTSLLPEPHRTTADRIALRFKRSEWNRMAADAQRLEWAWSVAAVSPAGEVTILDPAKGRRGKEVRLGSEAAIANVLLWIDGMHATR